MASPASGQRVGLPLPDVLKGGGRRGFQRNSASRDSGSKQGRHQMNSQLLRKSNHESEGNAKFLLRAGGVLRSIS